MYITLLLVLTQAFKGISLCALPSVAALGERVSQDMLCSSVHPYLGILLLVCFACVVLI